MEVAEAMLMCKKWSKVWENFILDTTKKTVSESVI